MYCEPGCSCDCCLNLHNDAISFQQQCYSLRVYGTANTDAEYEKHVNGDLIKRMNSVIGDLYTEIEVLKKDLVSKTKRAETVETENNKLQETFTSLKNVIRSLRIGSCDPEAPCDRMEDGDEGDFVCSYHASE